MPDPVRLTGLERGGLKSGTVHTATDGRDILINTPDGWEVDQPWLWFDGPAGSDGAGGPFGNPPPGAIGKGGPATIPAFLQCTWLIAEQIASMPWQVFTDGNKITTPAWIADPQNARLDGRSPGLDEERVRLSAPEFWSQVITSLLWFGEAFIYTPRGATGQILSPLFLIHPDYIEVEAGRFYVPTGDPYNPREYLDDTELLVIRGHMRPGRSRGFGVLGAYLSDLKMARTVRDYAGTILHNGIPAGYLKVNAPDLSEASANALKTKWMAAHGGTTRKIAVLNATTDFKPLGLDPVSLELINMWRLSAWEICTMFGVPPSKLGISLGDSMTYNNAQDDDARFVKDTLRVWVDRLENAITSRLAGNTYLKINLNSYLRANTTERFAAYSQALDPATGWMTVNEVRALEDLAPIPGGDIRPGITPPPTIV